MKGFLDHFRNQNRSQSTTRSDLTQCPYCSMQCTKWLHEDRGRFAVVNRTVSPNKEDPVTGGKLCVKGIHAPAHVWHNQRLTTPLLKSGGRWVPVTWRTALRWFARNIGGLQRQWGRDAVGVFGGGSMTNEETYLLGKMARLALGTGISTTTVDTHVFGSCGLSAGFRH
ncbi:molybdopterin-dependent oxidoreductase [Polycladomyces sp. WAk]|uniref:Molybdopterin-dependent oxidoreductase n=1 Tax=Polycladomyces zharkentensis TaxID=2807616 RepID=A0ABS2WIV2_9BACL|nr:molybdopterin-dependent oxidoreductase [Polycladomyces sp. WAk]MBN2909225.1 molybdopterin-dependent oxidoreductase [Polycladomyces sp. WAk]